MCDTLLNTFLRLSTQLRYGTRWARGVRRARRTSRRSRRAAAAPPSATASTRRPPAVTTAATDAATRTLVGDGSDQELSSKIFNSPHYFRFANFSFDSGRRNAWLGKKSVEGLPPKRARIKHSAVQSPKPQRSCGALPRDSDGTRCYQSCSDGATSSPEDSGEVAKTTASPTNGL